jgi:hypothetical protein
VNFRADFSWGNRKLSIAQQIDLHARGVDVTGVALQNHLYRLGDVDYISMQGNLYQVHRSINGQLRIHRGEHSGPLVEYARAEQQWRLAQGGLAGGMLPAGTPQPSTSRQVTLPMDGVEGQAPDFQVRVAVQVIYDAAEGGWRERRGAQLGAMLWRNAEGEWQRGTLSEFRNRPALLAPAGNLRTVELPALPAMPMQLEPVPAIVHYLWIGRDPLGRDALINMAFNARQAPRFQSILHVDLDTAALQRLTEEAGELMPDLVIRNLNDELFFQNLSGTPLGEQYRHITGAAQPYYPAASHVLRYPLLNAFGGIYLDVDSAILISIPPGQLVATDDGLLLGNWVPSALGSGYEPSHFASRPDSRILQAISLEMTQRYQAGRAHYDSIAPRDTRQRLQDFYREHSRLTGTGLFNDVLAQTPAYPLMPRMGLADSFGIYDPAYERSAFEAAMRHFPFATLHPIQPTRVPNWRQALARFEEPLPDAALLEHMRALNVPPDSGSDAALAALATLRAQGRSTEAIAQTLSRALEAMLASEASNDRDLLVMALLGPELHYMNELIRVQLILDQGFIGGPLRVGKRGPIKTIRRSGARYQLFDEVGKELTPPTNLEVALSRILFNNQPNAMDLAVQEQGNLRARLFERALKSRASLRSHLGMLPLTPPKLRLLGGYPMIDRSSLVSARRTLDDRLRLLYPDREICAAVKTELLARSSISGRAIELLVSDKETEWNQLDLTLRTWESAAGKHHVLEHDDPAVRVAARQHFGQELRRCWRRERTETMLSGGEERQVFSLAVAGDTFGALPNISADFSHVELLLLRNMGLAQDPSHFLFLFPRVVALWLSENRLTRCPPAVAQMPRLRLLHLDHNPIVLNDQTFAPLLASGGGAELQQIDLSGINTATDTLGLGGVAIEALGRLPKLDELIWLDNDGFTPEQLQAIGRLNRLTILDLTNCRLRLDAQSGAFMARLTNVRRLSLGGNIISALPDLKGLPRLIDLDLSQARIERIPQAVIDLVQRQPAGLLAVDLSGNRITDVEALLSALARPLDDGEKVIVALDDNPLPAVQIERLRGTRQSFAYSRDNWLGDDSGLQRQFEVLRQDAADAQFLDWLSDAVKREEDYDFGPDTASPRARAVAFARTFFQLDDAMARLREQVPDLNERFVAFRKRIYQRLQHLPHAILDDLTPPILYELEMHVAFFWQWCIAHAGLQRPAYASFIQKHYGVWLQYLREDQGWSSDQLRRGATQERFVQRLLETQGAFSASENPQYGDLYWLPYLGEMSARWANLQAHWDALGETLSEASSEPVDTSTWPPMLRNNLSAPAQALPGPALEAAADVDWGNTAVQLNEDQYRRAWAIFRAVKASEAERVAVQATEELVGPWWAGGGRLGEAP